MTYYPKSQIKTGLFENRSGVLFLANGDSYTGPYYEISSGRKFKGLSPSDQSEELFTAQSTTIFSPQDKIVTIELSDDMVQNYVAISKVPTEPRLLPSSNTPTLTKNDYEIGEFQRYFLYKINEKQYLEVSQSTFDKIKSKSREYVFELYLPFSISWTITGDKDKVYSTNQNIVRLTANRLKIHKFEEYFKNNYLQFYKG